MLIILEIPDGAEELKVEVTGKDPFSDKPYRTNAIYDEDDIWKMSNDFDVCIDSAFDRRPE